MVESEELCLIRIIRGPAAPAGARLSVGVGGASTIFVITVGGIWYFKSEVEPLAWPRSGAADIEIAIENKMKRG